MIWFKSRHKKIYIRGMTAVISKCVKIALHLMEYYSDISYIVTFGSVPTIIDQIEEVFSFGYLIIMQNYENSEIKYRSSICIEIIKELDF